MGLHGLSLENSQKFEERFGLRFEFRLGVWLTSKATIFSRDFNSDISVESWDFHGIRMGHGTPHETSIKLLVMGQATDSRLTESHGRPMELPSYEGSMEVS